MLKQKFNEILSKTKNQLIVIINDEQFYINLHKEMVMNDLGIIAVSERTGSASIVFFNDIDAIISDGQLYE